MTRHPIARVLVIVAMLAIAGAARGQVLLDRLEDAFALSNADGSLRADLSVLADMETYTADEPLPGMLFGDDPTFVNPRLALFVDLHATDHLQAHAQMRVDRGFDPGSSPGGRTRLDEWYLRARPMGDDRLNFQAGKFATVVGNWAPRNLSWDNPMITAPAPYEDILAITDRSVPPTSAAFLGRRNIADKKGDWLPVLWGPSYASGASVFGRLDRVDYAVEIKSASISSRPSTWDVHDVNFSDPTVSARVGVRPSPELALGTSVSHGRYLLIQTPRGDGDQTTFGLDASWQHHHLQIWGEIFHSTFEVPGIGDAEVVSGYIETKYKIDPRWWVALRWNQSFFGDVPDGRGGSASWDRDAWRADLALGHRVNRHVQAKIQYSYGDKDGRDIEGDHLFATQISVRF